MNFNKIFKELAGSENLYGIPISHITKVSYELFKILITQNYLGGEEDVSKSLYAIYSAANATKPILTIPTNTTTDPDPKSNPC